MSLCSSPPLSGYPQPDWLIDRERLGARLPPRVRARELWRVPGRTSRRLRRTPPDSQSRTWSGPASTWSPTARCGGRATPTDSRRPLTASISTIRRRARSHGHENPVPRSGRPDPPHAAGRSRGRRVFLRAITDRESRSPSPGLHDDPTGSERPLRRRSESRARVRRRRECRAQGSESSGRRRGPGRRALSPSAPDPAREYALEAIDRALAGIEETVLHTCFGYAHIVKKRLTGYPLLRGSMSAPRPTSPPTAQPASIRKCCATFRTK